MNAEQVIEEVRKQLRKGDIAFPVALAEAIGEETAKIVFKPEAYETDPAAFNVKGFGQFISRALNHPQPIHEACAEALEDVNYHEAAAYLRE